MQTDNRRGEGFSVSNVVKIVDIVVSKFVKNGSIGFQNSDDVKQNIISKYLEKEERIQNAYSENAKVDTYLSAVFYRMVLEYIRSTNSYSRKYCDFFEYYYNSTVDDGLTPELKTVVDYERQFFERILATLGANTIKTIVYCKVYYRLEISNVSAVALFGKSNAKWALSILNDDFKTDSDVYSAICNVSNKVNNKSLKPDAIRMFINSSLNTIISRMNYNGRAKYDKQSLGILFEMMNARKNPDSESIKKYLSLLLL